MSAPLSNPTDLLRLNAALDWFHTGHRDHSGIDWMETCAQRDHPVRTTLVNGALKAWLLTEDGDQVAVPRARWSNQFLWPEAYSSSLVDVRINGRIVSGYLVVNVDAVAALIESGDRTIIPQPAPSSPAYIPFYLAYMIELVERFDLIKDYNFSHKEMAGWIFDNPPVLPAGIKWSKNKASMVATMLQDPAFEGGGNFPAASKGRHPDPRKPFNDVSYPRPQRRS